MHAPLPTRLKVEWHPLPALAACAEAWRHLADRAIEPNAFYHPAVLLPAVPVFAPDAGAFVVRAAFGKWLGFFPMRRLRFRNGPGRTLTGFTTSYAPFGVPLVDRWQAEAVIESLLAHLAHDRHGGALLMLPLINEAGGFARALDAVLAATGRRHATFGAHERAELAPPAAERAGYIERAINSKRRKELRRQRNRLTDSGTLAFTTATKTDDFAIALADFFMLEARGWKGKAGTAASSETATRDFFERAVTGLAANGKARIDSLRLGDATLATCVTVLSGDTAWIWKIAYDETQAKNSPGVQLVTDFTEAFLTDPSIVRADSLAVASHPMIDHVWRERRPMADRLIELRPSVWPFALACRAEQARRDGIVGAKRLRAKMRERLGR